jgi:hypothetical protein
MYVPSGLAALLSGCLSKVLIRPSVYEKLMRSGLEPKFGFDLDE